MPNGQANGHSNAAQNFHNGTANNPNNNGANGHSIAMDNVPFLAGSGFGFDSAEVSGTPGADTAYYTQGDFIGTVSAPFSFGNIGVGDWDGDGDLEYRTPGLGDLIIERANGDTFEFSGVSIEDYDNDGVGYVSMNGGGADGSSYLLTSIYSSALREMTYRGHVSSPDGTYQVQDFQNFDDAFDFVFADQELTQLSCVAFGMALDDFILV
ncbi:hypothetical protein E7681_11080 [Thalassobius vesicularis]|uniref:Uncharacterized protein n=1 Tax=Thalassobius vesicularis TaxID=1294297 RepID=A0A4S3M7L2_9RHOB|nr:hypothetical protein [Thalassobius vesicularis]THD73239.1 hypothetical protein E7681_11080 [Thalassobius vesicularis]